jgi:cytochrome c1
MPFGLAALAALLTVYLAKTDGRNRLAPERAPWTSMWIPISLGLAAAVMAAGILLSPSASPSRWSHAAADLQRYGCAGCHTIPGIPNAVGQAGPALKDLRSRTYIAGSVRNEPEALAQWIVDPPKLDPFTAMPRTGISKTEARDIVEYLYQH